MSYLIENSLVVLKKEYEEDDSKYLSYEKHPLGDYYILTENVKPFFSIYDIAHYCKKKYRNDKLFLIAHRYFDSVQNEKITEFYVFNTLNIFEKSLTAFLYIKENELDSKQKIVQNNLEIAKKLLNCDTLHIILGDNIKEHEVVEYITTKPENSSIDLFDKNDQTQKIPLEVIGYQRPHNISVTRISTILRSIRVLEPQSKKIQKLFILIIMLILSIYSAEDIVAMGLEDYKKSIKKETLMLEQKYSDLQSKTQEKQRYMDELQIQLNILQQKPIFDPKNENETPTN